MNTLTKESSYSQKTLFIMSLIHGWCVSQTKCHDKKLVMTIPSMKGNLMNVLLSQSMFVIT